MILEKTSKFLSKVKISGGGRCNVTHDCLDNTALVSNYPRGNKALKQAFARFNVHGTINWFKENNVDLKLEADGRMFPASNSSDTIVDCFLQLAKKLNITIQTNCEVFAIKKTDSLFKIKTSLSEMEADAVFCCIGGHNNLGHYQFLINLGHKIKEPKPSLFTFNLTKHRINKELQGIAIKNASVKLHEKKTEVSGPLLITHWGFSGPAVLKLSAFEAEYFFEKNYNCTFSINWAYPLKPAAVEEALFLHQKNNLKALPYTKSQFAMPQRLWEFLCNEVEIINDKPWQEINKKSILKLAELLFNHKFEMQGKTTFKEEFVTCGGLELNEVDFKTMESKLHKNLFFCGEVLDIDGVTGGFNFQNAWTTAWIAANNFTIIKN